MKTIEITDEMYDKLIELATEMTTQDPRATRMPHIFQIQEKKKVYDWGMNGDNRIWVDQSSQTEIATQDEFLDYLDHLGMLPEDEEEREKKLIEYSEIWNDDWENSYWIEEHCPDLKECSYTWEYVYHNHFLTAKACQEHIRLNHYHYNEPKDYLNHAWRNPEMELVSEFLCGLVGKKMHT